MGSLFVPIAHARALVAMHLLEPRAPDSLFSWGFFNRVFEQKEYMESYVAEKVAREMLEKNPALRAQLDKWKGDRLDFFYRRHPSWDERKDLIPIYRVSSPPAAVR